MFDWPENERFGAKLEINGAAREIPLSGVMDFELPTGKHHIALRQLGHAKIDETVQLKFGERYEFKPEWKAAETGDGQGTVATAANPSNVDMLVSDALPELKHWSTDLAAAKRQAASAKKDVLVVFFGADNRQWCLQLGKDLLVNKEFRKYADSRFELVLLERQPPPRPSMARASAVRRRLQKSPPTTPSIASPRWFSLAPRGRRTSVRNTRNCRWSII